MIYFINFIEEVWLFEDNLDNQTIVCRIEVFDQSDKEIEEIRIKTKCKLYYKLREKYDFRDVDDKQLDYIKRIVKRLNEYS